MFLLYSSPPQLHYPQLSYFRSYAIIGKITFSGVFITKYLKFLANFQSPVFIKDPMFILFGKFSMPYVYSLPYVNSRL